MRKIHKLLVATASSILVMMGFGDCRCHKFLPLEYGTPYYNPDAVDNEQSEKKENRADSTGVNKDIDKVRKDLERVSPLYGVRRPPKDMLRDK